MKPVLQIFSSSQDNLKKHKHNVTMTLNFSKNQDFTIFAAKSLRLILLGVTALFSHGQKQVWYKHIYLIYY